MVLGNEISSSSSLKRKPEDGWVDRMSYEVVDVRSIEFAAILYKVQKSLGIYDKQKIQRLIQTQMKKEVLLQNRRYNPHTWFQDFVDGRIAYHERFKHPGSRVVEIIKDIRRNALAST